MFRRASTRLQQRRRSERPFRSSWTLWDAGSATSRVRRTSGGLPKCHASRDARCRDNATPESEVPAGNLDFRPNPEVDPNGNGADERPPTTNTKSESEATDDEYWDDDAEFIGYVLAKLNG